MTEKQLTPDGKTALERVLDALVEQNKTTNEKLEAIKNHSDPLFRRILITLTLGLGICLWDENFSANKEKRQSVCEALSTGKSMSDLSNEPEVETQNSLKALPGECRRILELEVNPDPACIAAGVRESVEAGVDFPKALVDEAYAVELPCVLNAPN